MVRTTFILAVLVVAGACAVMLSAADVKEVIVRFDDGSEQVVRPAPVKPSVPTTGPTPAPSSEPVALYPGQALHVHGNGDVRTWDFGDVDGSFNRLVGFSAAHVYDRPGKYTVCETIAAETSNDGVGRTPSRTVRVLADSRKEIRVARDANLANVLGNAAARTRLVLPRGAQFDVKTMIRIRSADVLLTAAEGEGDRPRIRNLATTAHTPAILVAAERFGVVGIEFDTDVPVASSNAKTSRSAIRIERGGAVVRDCVFRNVDDGVHCDAGAAGVVVQNCRFTDEIRAYNVWIDGSDIALLGNVGENSVHEHNVRSQSKTAKHVLIHANEFSNPPRMFKETITLREVQRAYVSGNTFRTGWAQIGLKEGAAASVTRQVVFDGNTLLDGAWFQVNPASVDITLRHNRIVCPEDNYMKAMYWDAVRVNGPYTVGVRIEGNIRVVEQPTARPFVRNAKSPREVVERDNRTELAKE